MFSPGVPVRGKMALFRPWRVETSSHTQMALLSLVTCLSCSQNRSTTFPLTAKHTFFSPLAEDFPFSGPAGRRKALCFSSISKLLMTWSLPLGQLLSAWEIVPPFSPQGTFGNVWRRFWLSHRRQAWECCWNPSEGWEQGCLLSILRCPGQPLGTEAGLLGSRSRVLGRRATPHLFPVFLTFPSSLTSCFPTNVLKSGTYTKVKACPSPFVLF